ncbi:MAG: hypothetical protein A2079_06100 [Geobacteraceae bacterium GWC2_48_7]|nr:MAG: hypothetical protein A2079_06100 [Geobacteraceae bacterium GWC2_48_7]
MNRYIGRFCIPKSCSAVLIFRGFQAGGALEVWDEQIGVTWGKKNGVWGDDTTISSGVAMIAWLADLATTTLRVEFADVEKLVSQSG